MIKSLYNPCENEVLKQKKNIKEEPCERGIYMDLLMEWKFLHGLKVVKFLLMYFRQGDGG